MAPSSSSPSTTRKATAPDTSLLNGLVATDTQRATFGGYWAHQRSGPRSLPDADYRCAGQRELDRGFVELTFTEPAFPAGWQAALGHRFDEAVEFWDVQPIVSDDGKAAP